MKSLKVVFASVAVVAIAIVAFAFAKKPLAPVTYNYNLQSFQRLEPGHTTELELRERTITQATFTNISNWTTSSVSFAPTSDMSAYIGSISFNEEATADGGGDGELTLSEALNALYNQYVSQNPDLMPSSFSVGSANITVQAADDIH